MKSKLSPKDYDKLVSACGIYDELRCKYKQISRMTLPAMAVHQFSRSSSDIQRLKYCVSDFEELIGADWYERR